MATPNPRYLPPPPERWSLAGSRAASRASAPTKPVTPPAAPVGLPWRAIAALALIYAATLTGIHSLWAAVLFWWLIGDIRRRSTWLMETVNRDANPRTYWLLLVSWACFCVLLVLGDLGFLETLR